MKPVMGRGNCIFVHATDQSKQNKFNTYEYVFLENVMHV